MDDRPFGTDSTNREGKVQSKAVFSYAMTLMDKIRGWEDEESWVEGPSSLHVCGHIKKKLWQEARYSIGYRKNT